MGRRIDNLDYKVPELTDYGIGYDPAQKGIRFTFADLATLVGGGGGGGSALTELTLACSDGTNHDVTCIKVGSVYTLYVNPSPSSRTPNTLTLEAADTTTHAVICVKIGGVYSLRVVP